MALTEQLLDSIAHFPAWLAVLICSITALYLYSTWHYGYWKKQGVSTSKPWPFIGSMSLRKMETIEEFDTREYKKHGRIYGAYIGRFPMLFVAEPELLRKMLVKDFHAFRNRMSMDMGDDIMMNMLTVLKNEEWKNVRNIVTPTFTTGKMKQMIAMMEECAQQLVDHLAKFEKESKPFEARGCCAAFAIDVIATCAFGTKVNSLENPDNDFILNARKAFSFSSRLFLLAFISERLFKLFRGFLPDTKTKYFADILEDVIKSRSLESEPRRDFLQLLLEAELVEESNDDAKNKMSSKKILTRNQVLAQAIIFLLAGSETTAITFCLALYNLALNEDCQKKLIKDIDEVMEKSNGTLTYDAIAQMQYLDMVISETLRMYPPLGRVDRVCEEDGYRLTDNIVLKKGMIVGVPIMAMHHDEEFYPNPYVFDPERFNAENRSARDPYTYLPFGYGPRNCVGMRFALLEIKIGMIYLFRKYLVKKSPQTEIPFKRDFSFLLQPASVNLQLERRK